MSAPDSARPGFDAYFMAIAKTVRTRADCVGNRVGAVLVRDGRIVSTGYNGTPEDMPNCTNGGCHRCAHRDQYPSGEAYDLCICVHAEQNALLAAARFGIAVESSTLYTTMRPCFGCTKEMLQAKVHAVYYLHDWPIKDATKRHEYEKLQARFPGGIRQMDVADDDEAWAVSNKRAAAEDVPGETGHRAP
ncbi:MAG: deoxycytidylate deaminase [Phycisphaeraceae bacterium]